LQLTNIHNLPQQFVDMATVEYETKPNEYRATSLLRGIRENILLRRHDKEIVVDVADMVWMLFGTAVHDVLKRAQEKDSELKEERLFKKYGDITLSGQFDLYCGETLTLTDYKTTSVWKVVYKSFTDWERQGNIYTVLLDEYGFLVKQYDVVAFLKDHSKTKAKYDSNYPQLPVVREQFKIDKNVVPETDKWIAERLAMLTEASKLADDDLPVCTEEERWYSGDKWAVMKKGRKSAVRVLDTEEAAIHWLQTELDVKGNPKGEYIDKRPGENRKCEDYCYAAPFCNWYKEQQKKGSAECES
jgi:hypothetical protein